MIQTSEYVSPGHPDKVADGIVSYLLDRYLEKDRRARFAVECQVKDNHVTLGGEVTSTVNMEADEMLLHVRSALRGIGYTEEYAARWGRENCLDPSAVDLTAHIGTQSPDIAQGVNQDGWGDQGIFWGMAVNDAARDFYPKDYWLARHLGRMLYESARDRTLDIGLDIKTQVTLEGDRVRQVVVAAPMMGTEEQRRATLAQVSTAVRQTCRCDADTEVIINGTGAYVRHASQGDCGTTGRKLAVDFYGGNCRIGGGTTWGKDPSKADVTLNIYARHKALEKMRRSGYETVYCAISCCIGRPYITLVYFDGAMNQLAFAEESRPASEIIASLGLYAPVYAYKNVHGLFELPPTCQTA